MKTGIVLVCALAAVFGASPLRACGNYVQLDARLALSTNGPAASNAVARLRGLGSEGFNALLETHQQLIAHHDPADPQWKRLRAVLDAVGGQRDCHASRLFWHTDFAAAQAEAQRSGKPILSLRLLGRLDEELSCANSRFFRTTLYANQEVSDYLRQHFVLHWKSVRPVPRITIDMGDGRKIERTITGNSIHYVLDANGAVVDALPGLYAPKAFLAGLQDAEATAVQAAKLDSAARARLLANFHRMRLDNINRRWADDLARIGVAGPAVAANVVLANATPAQERPNAAAAMPLAVSKSGLERSMLRAATPTRENLERTTNDDLWSKMAALRGQEAVLDSNSIALIRAKAAAAPDAMRLTLSKRVVEDPMLKRIQNLQRSIAEDTVRNEYSFHSRIHEWLAAPGAAPEVDALNRRVYAELFLTPDTDPWLGLAPEDALSALEGEGLVQSSKIQDPRSR